MIFRIAAQKHSNFDPSGSSDWFARSRLFGDKKRGSKQKLRAQGSQEDAP
jgi:hypothetical protein